MSKGETKVTTPFTCNDCTNQQATLFVGKMVDYLPQQQPEGWVTVTVSGGIGSAYAVAHYCPECKEKHG